MSSLVGFAMRSRPEESVWVFQGSGESRSRITDPQVLTRARSKDWISSESGPTEWAAMPRSVTRYNAFAQVESQFSSLVVGR